MTAPLDLDAAFGELCKHGDVSLRYEGRKFLVRVRMRNVREPTAAGSNTGSGLVYASGKTLELLEVAPVLAAAGALEAGSHGGERKLVL